MKLLIKIMIGLFLLILLLAVIAFIAVLVLDPHSNYERGEPYGLIEPYAAGGAVHGCRA